jgi:hypothetical protein
MLFLAFEKDDLVKRQKLLIIRINYNLSNQLINFYFLTQLTRDYQKLTRHNKYYDFKFPFEAFFKEFLFVFGV